MRSTEARPFVWLALALAFAPGCRSVPRVPGSNVEVLYSGTLDQVKPVDVVVAPIQNESGSREVPEPLLRQALVDGLVKRRYSPLALEYVDRQIVEAAYTPGTLREDAVLQVKVLSWDTSRWDSDGTLDVTLEAWMYDATQSGNAELWGGRLHEQMHLDPQLGSFAASTNLHEEVCRRIAARLLEAMPAREAQP